MKIFRLVRLVETSFLIGDRIKNFFFFQFLQKMMMYYKKVKIWQKNFFLKICKKLIGIECLEKQMKNQCVSRLLWSIW